MHILPDSAHGAPNPNTMTSPGVRTPSSPPTAALPPLPEVLERAGLTEYYGVLTENGFHSWDTVLDITEEDLTALNFKLGHRRILQREIATFRGIPLSLSLDPETPSSDHASLSSSALESLARQQAPGALREKRRYRRHPRPDLNAPKKPKTAYVNFADNLRNDREISALSFVDIAKEVGRQWQVLPPDQKRVYESRAAQAMQEYEAQMDEYKKTDSWRKHQAYLDEFRFQRTAQSKTAKRPTQSRTDSHHRYDYSRASPNSSDSPTSVPSSANTEAELCHNALTLALSEVVSLKNEMMDPNVHPYDRFHLPPEDLTRQAIYAFIRGLGSLFYVWNYDEVDDVLERVYRAQKPVDSMTLAECFIVAAVGGHYDMDSFPEPTRRALYLSATALFDETLARQDYLRTMRFLLSLSFYSLLEKHLSARYLIAAGLQIARWKCSTSSCDGDGSRRLVRSIIFIDCWLSYTLGYSTEVTSEDISMMSCSHHPVPTRIEEAIYHTTSQVGLIAAEIAKTLAAPELTTRDNIDALAHKLERWRTNLPPILQLSSLTSGEPTELTIYQKRAILMVHILYLGAVILLYRQLLVATAEKHLAGDAKWELDLTADDARTYVHECALAAQQTVRILRLIAFDGTLTKRCWIMIYWSFTACIVLLYSSTTKLLDNQNGSSEEDLNYAKGCIDILEPCRKYEPIAGRYLDTVWPIYDHLKYIHQRTANRTKASIFALVHPTDVTPSPPIPLSKEEIGPISEKLSGLLMDPFGRKQRYNGNVGSRRVLNADGSCTVFWWR
ncbi:hypothetical protein P154DRAFT_518226 [Amniculicola lignicola CBS 123094]|uniref:HMG box domain-containing protein n=1 Tax=Amniculicola lignicola CBS 123094 TaxID=1392246 RepID=A0A6A5WYD8_9PLEO|nr:hypothetical protein P154DRAFT_518226 [Amniculicola lignicola CBS 123094]